MSRTIGAVNKPKFCNVSLADLNATLQVGAMVPVDIRFAEALNLTSSEPINNRVKLESAQEEKIQFNKITW